MSISNEFRINELIVSGSSAITSNSSFDGNSNVIIQDNIVQFGESFGYIEKPKYNETELVKAIDIKVDELIKQGPKQGPDVVPRKVYNDLSGSYSSSLQEITKLTLKNIELSSNIESLNIEMESLKISLDSSMLLRSNAENQFQVLQDKYQSTLIDFQNALSKGIREGIERVSLNAQVEGLKAQKELLVRQIEVQDARQASAVALSGKIFEEAINSGWKIPDANVGNAEKKGLIIETENDNVKKFKNGRTVYFYNFDPENSATFTFNTTENWFLYPSKITVPPRIDDRAGVTTVNFGFKPKGKTSDRNSVDAGTLNITTSSGDTMKMYIAYKKEVQRQDTWDTVNFEVIEGIEK